MVNSRKHSPEGPRKACGGLGVPHGWTGAEQETLWDKSLPQTVRCEKQGCPILPPVPVACPVCKSRWGGVLGNSQLLSSWENFTPQIRKIEILLDHFYYMESLNSHGVCYLCYKVTFDVSSAFKRWFSCFRGAESRHSRFFGCVSMYSM